MTTTMIRSWSIDPPHVSAGRLPHLDGLRSLALLGVLLYHFHVPLFSGGFIGVDIFFTLSGYLITRNLLHAIILDRPHFSLTSFYKRRFFRLFPASCFTVFVTMIATTLFVTPDKAASIFKSSVAGLTLSSNVYFHREASYFDQSFEMRALLHLWSLSVEEQFYLIWPPLLLAVVSFSSRSSSLSSNAVAVAFNSLLVVTVLSFAFAVCTHFSFPSWTFYELPSRIFQFAIGALLSMHMFNSEVNQINDSNTKSKHGIAVAQGKEEKGSDLFLSMSPSAPLSTTTTETAKTYDTITTSVSSTESSSSPTSFSTPSVLLMGGSIQDVDNETESDASSDGFFEEPDLDKINDTDDMLSILSLLTILLAFALLPENCPPYLALPINITAAILIALPDSIVCQVVFTNSAAISLGRASYAIYLIHWPLAIIAKYVLQGIDVPVIFHTPLLLPLSIVLGYYMFHHIESPLRVPRSSRHVLTVIAVGACTLALAVYGSLTNGIASRFPEYGQTGWRNDSESIHGDYYSYVRVVNDQFPGIGHPNIYVRRVGDFTGPKSKYVFFGDSFTEHLTGALYHTGIRQRVHFEFHYSFHCGFRAMTSLSTWDGISSGFRCADTLPLLWRHIDMISNDSIIVVANWWCAPANFAPMLIDLRNELVARGKQVAIFAEPPGIAEPRQTYYPCADLRVLPLGRLWARLLGRPFVGGKNCLPFDEGNPPELHTALQRRVYDSIFHTTLNDTLFFDIFKYMCTKDAQHRYLCRPPANLDGVVHDIGYKHDLAHLSYVGSDYVTDFVEAELFPQDNRLLHHKKEQRYTL